MRAGKIPASRFYEALLLGSVFFIFRTIGNDNMASYFTSSYLGKAKISSHYGRCSSCSKLTLLQSYKSTCFTTLFNVPLFPTGTYFILDECPLCGQRGITTIRKYAKVRSRTLAVMMDGFASDADTPSNCAHALRTLMLYDEVSWFS